MVLDELKGYRYRDHSLWGQVGGDLLDLGILISPLELSFFLSLPIVSQFPVPLGGGKREF